jgi:hypothetical protein
MMAAQNFREEHAREDDVIGKLVCPVHFARASTLRKGLPTTLSGFPFLCLFSHLQLDGPQMNTDRYRFKKFLRVKKSLTF